MLVFPIIIVSLVQKWLRGTFKYHNLYFIINLVDKIRQSILDGNFFEFKKEFLRRYYQ